MTNINLPYKTKRMNFIKNHLEKPLFKISGRKVTKVTPFLLFLPIIDLQS